MKRNKNIFDNIGALIPGYIGYSERDGRRNSDKILRESIIIKLDVIERKMYEVMGVLLEDKNIKKAATVDKLRKELNTCSSKIKYSVNGYSSFFSQSKIKEEELLHIYKIDLDLLQLIEKIESQSDFSEFDIIKVSIDELKVVLDRRNLYLNEYKY